MKAVIQNEFGEASVLHFTDVDYPSIHEGEVLIKAVYTSVNYADIKKRVGSKGEGKFPMMLGLDVAGVVQEVSANSLFEVGDRVIAFPKNGSYAEYVVANEKLVFKIPDSLSIEQAAAMPTVTFTSYILLEKIGQVKPTDTIVIHSAAGGIGAMMIQLAKLMGVQKIITTVGNLEKASYLKELGADVVCTYDTFTEVVLEETNQVGANVIFDSVAGEVTTKSFDCLAYYGTLVQFGNSSGKAGTVKTSDLHSSCRNIKGFSLNTTRDLHPELLAPIGEKVIEFFAAGKLNVPIAQVFHLSEVVLAHQLIESRKHKGKVLLKIEE